MTSECYTVTVPVATTPADRHELAKKFAAAGDLYNAVLDTVWRRHRAARRDRRDVGLREGAIARWAMDQLPRCHVGDHLGCHETQAVVARVWQAYSAWRDGRTRPPRHKTRKRPLRSVQGTGKASTLRVKPARREIVWSRQLRDGTKRPDLCLPLRLDPADECHMDLVAALDEGRYTQARLVRERINGRDYYYAQIICAGWPPARGRSLGEGLVGIDLGPSKAAVVTDAGPTRQTPEALPAVHERVAELRRLQRRLDRQHRAGSPACFDEAGRHHKGACDWQPSRRARTTLDEIRDLKRRLAAARRAATGELVNRIVASGTRVHAEALNYRAWQRLWGRAVAAHAPGDLIARLRVTLAALGGELVPIDPRHTRLSQTCLCGRVEYKHLGQRVHHCPACGLESDRDVLAAHLARHARGDRLDLPAARREWAGWHRHGDAPAGEVEAQPNPRPPQPPAAATPAGGQSGSSETPHPAGEARGQSRCGPAGEPATDGGGVASHPASALVPPDGGERARTAMASTDAASSTDADRLPPPAGGSARAGRQNGPVHPGLTREPSHRPARRDAITRA